MAHPHSLVALVPMRHDSERVPGKNYRSLAGKPLYAHILETLEGCAAVRKIVVDTDSHVIKQGLKQSFPSVHVLDRPENLRGGKVSMNQVLLHDVEEVVSQFYLQTHSTNPLLSPATIQQAIETFFEGYPEYDSLFSVTRVAKRLWDGEGKPVNHDPRILLRTQDLPPLYEENSCLYIFERETFIRRKNRLGEKPLLFEIDHVEAWDIDEEFDFQVVNHLIRSK